MRWILVLALGGCGYSIRSTQFAPRPAPRPSDCAVDFSHERPEELARTHERVGTICFAQPGDEYDPFREGRSAHRDMSAEACRLGGELIAPQAACQYRDADGPGVEYGVWRTKKR